MPEYTTTEIAAQCRVSERTVQRWIEKERLPVQEIMRNRYIVDDADIERMKPRTIQGHRDELMHRIEAMELHIEALEARIAELERIIEEMRTAKTPQPRILKPAPAEYRVTPVHEHKASSLPDGSLLSSDFAERHQVNRYTFRDQIVKGVRGEKG